MNLLIHSICGSIRLKNIRIGFKRTLYVGGYRSHEALDPPYTQYMQLNPIKGIGLKPLVRRTYTSCG